MIKNVMVLVVAAIGASVGCGAADMDGEAFGDSDADIASFEAELGEAGCGTIQCTPQNSCAAINIPQCGLYGLVLSPVVYGSAGCPNQFVVEDTSPPTFGKRIFPMFTWQGPTLTAANCASAKVESAIYGKFGAGSATLAGKQTHRGVWQGSHCAMTSTEERPYVLPSANLTAVRATASATLGGIQQRVNVGFWQPCN
jgi:hypothetical protein